MRNLFELAEDPKNYTAVRIKLATSEDVASWSYGEVRSSETINTAASVSSVRPIAARCLVPSEELSLLFIETGRIH